ncbi:glycosyltransferase family 2 protein [Pontibacter sp. H249]|uniref:glycosyltransferase family 2 protein n=1 Tax=Pontibacter sp. H249 TaxID=3133420 RepID=UPI0030C3BBFA
MIIEDLISVVIATYNGSRYLEEQLTSIFNQTYKNFEVIVCDDISTDDTIKILQEYEKKYRLRYYVNESRLGVVKNFEKAITYAQGKYIALSDQDDIWKPEKLELSLHLLKAIEQKDGEGKPALVFSDLAVVDDNLNIINNSYWDYMKLNPKNTQLNRVLVENVVTGCTALMNKATIDMALPIPKDAMMHDVWFLLVASYFGNVSYLLNRTVLYRQHTNNVVGAHQATLYQKIKSGILKIKNNDFLLLGPEIKQASSFYNAYIDKLSNQPNKLKILKAFIAIKDSSFLEKKYLIIKHQFYRCTLKKTVNILLRA